MHQNIHPVKPHPANAVFSKDVFGTAKIGESFFLTKLFILKAFLFLLKTLQQFCSLTVEGFSIIIISLI
jgi:hypothetical protein